MKRKFNRDLFINTNVRHAANASVAVIDRLQAFNAHEQVAGLGAVFLMMAEHHGISAQDAFSVITNIMNDAEGRRAEFAAVKMYMENEL